MATDSVRLIFYEGVHNMPTRVFAERIPLTFTGADVKNRVAIVDGLDPTRFTLFTSGGLPVETHASLAEQGVHAADYIKAVPSISHR